MVKLPNGKWKTKVTDSLDMAQSVEGKYRTVAIKQSVFDIYDAPSIDIVWRKYFQWAKANKRSWKADLSRWDTHIAPHVKGLKMDRVTPQIVQEIISAMNTGASTSTRSTATA